MPPLDPLVVLAIGIVAILALIIVLRVNAFVALIAAAMLVSVLAPGELADKMPRVAKAFGESAGKIGIVIGMAAIIGQCMMESGAADRVVRSFLAALGVKRASWALLGSGYVLSIPVFFDTVFYLLVPLARSLFKSTGRDFLKYVLAIAAGGAATHTLVPPTPGPLLMAAALQVDIGWMIMIGALVALPASIAGLAYASFVNRRMPIPLRPLVSYKEPEPLADHELPGLFVSVLPIVLPVLLISANTIISSIAGKEPAEEMKELVGWAKLLGDANLALFISAVAAMVVLVRQRKLSLTELGRTTETALMSGGLIILITAAGGAFGAMLDAAQVGPAVKQQFGAEAASGLGLILLGFGIAAVLKVAQGSSTVAMITAAGMMASIVQSAGGLPYHPVYLATAIGSGSLMGSWMNDSGFWIVSKMSGMTETEALKSFTVMLLVMGTVGLLVSILLATVLPLTPAT